MVSYHVGDNPLSRAPIIKNVIKIQNLAPTFNSCHQLYVGQITMSSTAVWPSNNNSDLGDTIIGWTLKRLVTESPNWRHLEIQRKAEFLRLKRRHCQYDIGDKMSTQTCHQHSRSSASALNIEVADHWAEQDRCCRRRSISREAVFGSIWRYSNSFDCKMISLADLSIIRNALTDLMES